VGKKTPWLDVMFAGFAWYRRLRGGRWYRVWDLPFIQGGFELWTRTLLPHVPGRVLATEDYDAQLFQRDLNISKEAFAKAQTVMFPNADEECCCSHTIAEHDIDEGCNVEGCDCSDFG
jgi:hypothetical protein